MDKNIFEKLVTKKLSKEINSAEDQELNYYLKDKLYRDRYEWIENKWKQAKNNTAVRHNKERGLQLLRDKIKNHTEESISKQKPKARNLAPWYAAASIVLLIAIGLVFKNGVFQLLYQYEVAYHSYESPLGERIQVMLPDSSIVFLQSNTKIHIPINFKENRSVQLIGEAFFDVVRNENKPFRIETKDQVTTVLGTSFNICSNTEKTDQISVKTGKVKVMGKLSRQEMDIVPGQQITVLNDKLVLTSILNQDALFGWIEGKLVFDKASVKTIKTKIENWYGVKVTLDNLDTSSVQLTGVYHNTPVDDLMKLISYSTNLQYKIKDGKIHLYQNR